MTEQTKAMRGKRVLEMREALDLTQETFMARLNSIALSLGINRRYSGNDISQRENGGRKLDVEDYAILSFVDPKRWTWMWLAFGEELKVKPRATAPRSGEGLDDRKRGSGGR